MKRLLTTIIIISMFLGVSAEAAPLVKLIDAEKDIIRVCTPSSDGEVVSVLIINPGFSEADVSENGSSAVQYYGRGTAADGSFSVDIGMFDAAKTGGGEYKIVVSTAESSVTDTFSFYFLKKKLDVIDDLNNATDVSKIIDTIFEAYSLNTSEVYKTVSKKAVADFLGKRSNYEKNVTNMYNELVRALCITAYQQGNDALFEDDRITYTETIGIDNTPIYEDYLKCLSKDGRTAVNSALSGGDYSTTDDIKAMFEKLVLLHLITDYNEMGFGHVPKFLDKYKTEYISAGINVDKLSVASNKSSIYQTMVASDAVSLKALADIVATELKVVGTRQSKSSGGSSGGRTATSGVSQGNGYVINLESPFTDTDKVEWAEESIAALYKMGAISGKTTSMFAPNDTVTRAEFTKMLVTAFFGEPQDKEKSFEDTDGWAVPYVAYAAKNDIVSGTGENVFNPNGNITREQAATITARALSKMGYSNKERSDTFSDDSEISIWAKESVYMLSVAGVISGRENKHFCPLDNMTRAEAAKVIYYSMKLLGGTEG